MQRHLLHPLVFVMAILFVASGLVWSVDAFFNMGNSMQQFEGSALAAQGWGWAHIISGTIWVVLFSGGLVGATINFLNFIRPSAKTTKDFSPIKDMDSDEFRLLNIWINTNTYESEHLKHLWKEEK
jgi:hypothetical protein